MGLEHLAHFVFGCIKRQIPNVDLHCVPPQSCNYLAPELLPALLTVRAVLRGFHRVSEREAASGLGRALPTLPRTKRSDFRDPAGSGGHLRTSAIPCARARFCGSATARRRGDGG